MSGLSERSTQEEVYQVINSAFTPTFAEIPQQHQTESMAFAWLEKTKLSGIWLQNCFDEVPVECRSPRFMLLAAKMGCSVLKVATPEQYPNYRELALASITVNSSALAYLDPRFRDEQMLECAQHIWPYLMFIVTQTCDWVFEVMSNALLDKSARGDLLFALIAPQERLREPLHSYLTLTELSKRMWACHVIRDHGHLPMLATKVRDGEWFDGGSRKMEKPDSLEHAVQGFGNLRPHDDEGEIILMAYILGYPIDEVVPAMTGNLKKFLLEMYSEDELKPFMKTDVGLRGAMLEGALGL